MAQFHCYFFTNQNFLQIKDAHFVRTKLAQDSIWLCKIRILWFEFYSLFYQDIFSPFIEETGQLFRKALAAIHLFAISDNCLNVFIQCHFHPRHSRSSVNQIPTSTIVIAPLQFHLNKSKISAIE